MWYIVSLTKLDSFMSLDIPNKDRYGNKDLELFSQTKKVKNFLI